MKKKILIMTLNMDVTQATPKVIEATKGLLAATYEIYCPSFELIEKDEETIADHFLQNIRQEFINAEQEFMETQRDLAETNDGSTENAKISNIEFYRMFIGDVEQAEPQPEDTSDPPQD